MEGLACSAEYGEKVRRETNDLRMFHPECELSNSVVITAECEGVS